MSNKVYSAICAVQTELAKQGIGKDSENKFDNYKFRGIDAVYNALSPLLAKHGLCILPRMLSRSCEERQSQKGGALFYVTVEAEFDFVCAEDGSKHTVKTYGEAMDRGDKATNKAMSAAYKYAAFQSFAIPTEGDNDADASSHTVEAQAPAGSARRAVQDAHAVMDPEEQKFLSETATQIQADIACGNLEKAVANLWSLDQDEKLAIWALFDAKPRAALKKAEKDMLAELKNRVESHVLVGKADAAIAVMRNLPVAEKMSVWKSLSEEHQEAIKKAQAQAAVEKTVEMAGAL